MARIRLLLLYAQSDENKTLSYQHSWPRAFLSDSRFDCTTINASVVGKPARARAMAAARTVRCDAIVLLHSVFSNASMLQGRLREIVERRPEPKVLFLGNEYKLLPEKVAFAAELGVGLLISLLSSPEARSLYRGRLGCEVAYIPNAPLDPELFRPVVPEEERRVEIGYRAYENPWYLGHQERRLLADAFLAAAPRLGLSVDITLDDGSRLDERGWAAFLNRCSGQLGSEAGGDYFDIDDGLRRSVVGFLAEHPDATFDEVYERFFRGIRHPVSGRALSGRMVEAAGTRTAQLLIEGHYGGIFQPDVHYIPLRCDLSNVDEAVAKFRDDAFRREIVDNAYRVAHEQMTFPRLLDRFSSALRPLLR